MDANDNGVVSVSEFVKNRLYFMTLNNTLDLNEGEPLDHFFCTDDIFKYENFYDDFGPLNLAMLYRYCQTLNLKMRHIRATRIIHAASSAPKKRVNAAYLIGCYSMIYLGFTPQQAYTALMTDNKEDFVEFRDASSAEPYTISLLDCFNGLYKAKTMGFFNFENFDCDHYEFYERVEHGDLNWIVPRKFLAFCGPHNVCENIGSYPVHGVPFYYRYFQANDIMVIIRLNKRAYSASLFTRAGFAHRDLYFMDGSTPTDEILNEFLQICEGACGAIAVHCKAGLGRTGTLIACYIMKHYRFTAREAIAWIRICRPGSIIGPQQKWLLSKMTEMWHAGQVFRRRRWRAPSAVPAPPVHRSPIYALRPGQPFAGLSSKFHRQHVRKHCRTMVQQPFIETMAIGTKGRFTTLPSTRGCTISDSQKTRNKMRQRQQNKAQQNAATRAINRILCFVSEYEDENNETGSSGDSRNDDEDIEDNCTIRSALLAMIQRKVNTMKLDDQIAESDEDDDDDEDENNTDGEESDDEDEEAANNNNLQQTKKEPAEDSESSGLEQEVTENNDNNPVAGKSSNNNNNAAKALTHRDVNGGNITQGDKLNMIKAQRSRYNRNTIQSTSNNVTATKVIVRASEIKSSSINQPHIMTRRTQARMPSKSPQTPHNLSATTRSNINSTNTKRRATEAQVVNGNDNVAGCSSPRRTSPRLAVQVTATAVGGAEAPSSSSASSDCEDTPNSRSKTIRPTRKTWVSRIVPNVDTIGVPSVQLTGMETRSKRALISERRIVKVFRKTNQMGTPTKARKVDAPSTSKN